MLCEIYLNNNKKGFGKKKKEKLANLSSHPNLPRSNQISIYSSVKRNDNKTLTIGHMWKVK